MDVVSLRAGWERRENEMEEEREGIVKKKEGWRLKRRGGGWKVRNGDYVRVG